MSAMPDKRFAAMHYRKDRDNVLFVGGMWDYIFTVKTNLLTEYNDVSQTAKPLMSVDLGNGCAAINQKTGGYQLNKLIPVIKLVYWEFFHS